MRVWRLLSTQTRITLNLKKKKKKKKRNSIKLRDEFILSFLR